MSSYTKLWSSIVHSTVWRESPETKVVWITMLAISDAGGYVAASEPGLADAARVTLEQCQAALELFRTPDPYSRTKEHEGRRIENCDGGWIILNYRKHREGISIEVRRAQNREAAKKHRAKLAALRASADPSAVSAKVSNGQHRSAQAEAAVVSRKQKAEAGEEEGTVVGLSGIPESLHGLVSGYVRAARFPEAVIREIAAINSGMHPPAYDWPTIGTALSEMQAAGAPFSSNALRGFCRKVGEVKAPRAPMDEYEVAIAAAKAREPRA